jgi:hypothetical protein
MTLGEQQLSTFFWQLHQGRSLKHSQRKIKHPNWGKNFRQNFCNIKPRPDIRTGAKFLQISCQDQTSKLGQVLESQGSHSVSVSSPMELWQDKDDDLTEIAFYFNIPNGIILLKISVIKNFLNKTISAKKSFPTSGITRITFCLWESPSGIIA